MGDLIAPATDEIARAIGVGVYPLMTGSVAFLAADVAIPANSNTTIFNGGVPITLPSSPRDLSNQFYNAQIAILMGATAGICECFTANAPASVVSIGASGWATLQIWNWGSNNPDGQLLNGSVVCRCNQAATAKKVDPLGISPTAVTWCQQFFVWQ